MCQTKKCKNVNLYICTIQICAIIQIHRKSAAFQKNTVDFCHIAWYKMTVSILHLHTTQERMPL